MIRFFSQCGIAHLVLDVFTILVQSKNLLHIYVVMCANTLGTVGALFPLSGVFFPQLVYSPPSQGKFLSHYKHFLINLTPSGFLLFCSLHFPCILCLHASNIWYQSRLVLAFHHLQALLKFCLRLGQDLTSISRLIHSLRQIKDLGLLKIFI